MFKWEIPTKYPTLPTKLNNNTIISNAYKQLEVTTFTTTGELCVGGNTSVTQQ